MDLKRISYELIAPQHSLLNKFERTFGFNCKQFGGKFCFTFLVTYFFSSQFVDSPRGYHKMPPCFASCSYVTKPDTGGASKTCKGIDMNIFSNVYFLCYEFRLLLFYEIFKILQRSDEQTGNPYQVIKLRNYEIVCFWNENSNPKISLDHFHNLVKN